jgi:hypothetical protein
MRQPAPARELTRIDVPLIDWSDRFFDEDIGKKLTVHVADVVLTDDEVLFFLNDLFFCSQH